MYSRTLGMTLSLFMASGVIFTSVLFGDPPPPVECKTGLDAIGTCFGPGPNGKCNNGCSNAAAGPGTSGTDWRNKSVHIHNNTGNSVNGGTALANCRRERVCDTRTVNMAECDLVTDKCLEIVKPTPQDKYDPPVCTEHFTIYKKWVQSPDAVINPCPVQPPVPAPKPNTEPITPVPDPIGL